MKLTLNPVDHVKEAAIPNDASCNYVHLGHVLRSGQVLGTIVTQAGNDEPQPLPAFE
jgi:hypothetical protein